jgi:hypothetical protein
MENQSKIFNYDPVLKTHYVEIKSFVPPYDLSDLIFELDPSTSLEDVIFAENPENPGNTVVFTPNGRSTAIYAPGVPNRLGITS